MKFAYSMLRDFVDTSRSPEEIAELLTMAGFEVEGLEQVEDEAVLDVKVVSNRGDGLSVLGLAREVLAKDLAAQPTELYRRAEARFPAPDLEASDASKRAKISIETPNCTRYAARIFEGNFAASAPDIVRKRLRVAGIRSISLLVDLTNYVMLELGQPMHAFDLDKLRDSRIAVRDAKQGEKLTTLDGVEHDLGRDQVMIYDGAGPVGAAGVMGGLETEVTESTTRMLLESAHFVNTAVRRTRKQMSLSTEASYRFERSVDPEGAVAGLNRFAELLAQVDGGKSLVPGVIDSYPTKAPLKRVQLSVRRASELLGMPVTVAEASEYLTRLGFGVEIQSDSLLSTVPSWRPDVVEEYDLIEEVGRIHGFDKIPEAPLMGVTTQGGVFDEYKMAEELRDVALSLGFVQNTSHSLGDLHPLDDRSSRRIGPRNPNSPEMAFLRNSLWPSLAENARRNGSKNLLLFEMNRVFGLDGALSERSQLALLSSGTPSAEHWEKVVPAQPSFYSMKGVIEELLGHLGIECSFEPSEDARLHPTRQARAMHPGGQLAILGQIDPDIAEQLGFHAETYLGQLDVDAAIAAAKPRKRMEPISRNPAVRRDIAILIDKAVPYQEIEQQIRASVGSVLEKQWLFDVYAGKGIPEGKHSLAIALQLRKLGENFTDEEANQVRDAAVRALQRLGATQR